MSIGERIKRFGLVVFGTAKGLADALDIKPPALQQYINGEYQPGAPFLKKIWELGCSVEWLLFGHGDMFATNEAGLLLKGKAMVLREQQEARSGEFKRTAKKMALSTIEN